MIHALKTTGLRKTFGGVRGEQAVIAVDDLSCEIAKGEIYGFLGPNGAGKTTTIRIIMGLCIPDTGEMAMLGRSYTGNPLPAKVGYLPEEHLFYPHLKVERFLALMAELGLNERGITVKGEVDRVCRLMELDRIMSTKIGNLSKGNRQKVALAQAFLGTPDLLILDEPSSGLDPLASRRLTSNLTALRDDGVTVMLSSHRLTEVELVSDRIGLIKGGRMVLEGETSTLMEKGSAETLEELFLSVYQEREGE